MTIADAPVSAWLELFAVDAHTLKVGVALILAFCGIAGWMLAGKVAPAPKGPAPAVRAVDGLVRDYVAPEPQPRASVHELWCQRRAAETPIFAALAREMGLGLALGVTA